MEFLILIGTGVFALLWAAEAIDSLVFRRTAETERERKRKENAIAAHKAIEEAGGIHALRKMNAERKRREEEEEAILTELYGPREREDNGYSAIPRYNPRGPQNRSMRH